MTLDDDDLKKMQAVFATKADLKKLRKELDQRFLSVASKEDLKKLREDLWDQFLKDFETKTDHQDSVDELKAMIQNLPTKEEFFARMDKLSGEYKKIDEAQTIQSSQIGEHEDELTDHDKRIVALEQTSIATPV